MKKEVKVTICPPADLRPPKYSKAQEIRAKIIGANVKDGVGTRRRIHSRRGTVGERDLYRQAWNDEMAASKEKDVENRLLNRLIGDEE